METQETLKTGAESVDAMLALRITGDPLDRCGKRDCNAGIEV
jgi:hypothetical protein